MNRLNRLATGWMEAAWLMAVIITPLFFNVHSQRIFEADKIALLRSIIWLGLAAWGIKAISGEGAGFEMKKAWAGFVSLLKQPFVLPVSAFGLAALIATVFSINPNISIYGTYHRFQGIITTFSYIGFFAMLAVNLRTRPQVERIINAVVLSGVPVALYAILQHYSLDPFVWSADTELRATSTMGNPIFAAAFMGMALMLVLARMLQAFEQYSVSRAASQLLRGVFYALLAAVNLVAIWFTISRGPLVGVLVGLIFFGLLTLLRWQKRGLTFAVVGLGLAAVVFLITLNIPNGPLESLRKDPFVGPLGQLFESSGGTGRVRVLTWNGMLRLVQPHEPLMLADGQPDPWNSLRPLLGYGPETLQLAYESFYTPEMFQIEARNSLVDRAHNEFWDALAFGGLFGLLARYALFFAAFYFVFQKLNLIKDKKDTWLFWGLIAVGGAAGGFGLVQLQGLEYLGIGLPLGLLTGAGLYLLWCVFRPASPTEPVKEGWQAILLIGLLAALTTHYTEILFGIPVVSSLLLFWLALAVIYVLVQVPAAQLEVKPVAEAVYSKKRQRGLVRSNNSFQWQSIVQHTFILAVILVTLGYGFVVNPQQATSAGQIVGDSLTTLAGDPPRVTYGIFGMLAFSALLGALLLKLEEDSFAEQPFQWGSALLSFGFALIFSFFVWLGHAGQLIRVTATAKDDMSGLIANINWLLAGFYVLLLLMGLAAAWVFAEAGKPNRSAARSPLQWLGIVLLPVSALAGVVTFNLNNTQADMIYKLAGTAAATGQYQAVFRLYDEALKLTPNQDLYWLFSGKAYYDAIDSAPPDQQESLIKLAEERFLKAEEVNPLLMDHTMNLARTYRRWWGSTTDEVQRQKYFEEADRWYAHALAIKPSRADFWMEWAELYFLKGDRETGVEKLQMGFQVDETYSPLYRLQARLFNLDAENTSNDAQKKAYYEQAIQAYLKAVEYAAVSSVSPLDAYSELAQIYLKQQRIEEAKNALAQIEAAGGKPLQEWIDIGNYYANLNDLASAREVFLHVAELDAGDNQWQVYRAIGNLSRSLGEPKKAREYLLKALEIAPEEQKASIQAALDSIGP